MESILAQFNPNERYTIESQARAGNLAVQLAIANLFDEKNNHEQAIHWFNRAVENPQFQELPSIDQGDTYYNRALIHEKLYNFEVAARDFKLAIKSGYVTALVNLCALYTRRKKMTELTKILHENIVNGNFDLLMNVRPIVTEHLNNSNYQYALDKGIFNIIYNLAIYDCKNRAFDQAITWLKATSKYHHLPSLCLLGAIYLARANHDAFNELLAFIDEEIGSHELNKTTIENYYHQVFVKQFKRPGSRA